MVNLKGKKIASLGKMQIFRGGLSPRPDAELVRVFLRQKKKKNLKRKLSRKTV